MGSKWNTSDSCITVEYIQFIVLLRKYSNINWGKIFEVRIQLSGFFFINCKLIEHMLYSVAKIRSYCKVEIIYH